jgi:hypothetical protein
MPFAKATIANGTSLSPAVGIQDKRIAAIITPAAWTAANLTFQGSHDGTLFNDIFDEAGAELSVTATAAKYIGIDASAMELSGMAFIKVRSGTTGTPVNQGAARDIILVLA